jgi:hypothetical protein
MTHDHSIRVAKRLELLRDLHAFHNKRAVEAAAFGEPEARRHREQAAKIGLIIATIEHDDAIKRDRSAGR